MPKNCSTHVVHALVLMFLIAPLQSQAQQSWSTAAVNIQGRTTTILQNRILVRMQDARSRNVAEQLLPAGFHIDDQFLQPQQTRWFSNTNAPVQRLSDDLYSAEDRLTRTFTVLIPAGVSPLDAVRSLLTKHSSVIEFAEPWYVAETQGQPNDPMQNEQAYLATIKARAAWDVYEGDSTIVIGISDDGVQQNHEDLGPNIALNTNEIPDNGVDDDANGYIDDYNGYNFTYQMDGTKPGSTTSIESFGHGTKVTGIAAAAANNGVGIAGVGFRSKFFPMKTAKRTGGGIVFGYQSLIYAAQRKFSVVNTSWGIVKPRSPIDQSVIDYCIASNTLIVASGGNHGTDEPGAAWRWMNFPASYRGVLGVGETSTDDKVTATSGVGINADVYAPGNYAYTTEAPEGYTSFQVQGTSFASPIAAGVAALVRGKWPNLSPLQVAEHLRQTADDIASTNNAIEGFAPRRVNAERALKTDPSTQASVRIVGGTAKLPKASAPNRYRAGDTIDLVLNLRSFLSDVNLETVLQVQDANGWQIQILNEGQSAGLLTQTATKAVGPFRIVVSAIGQGHCVLTLAMSGKGYDDKDVFMLQPPDAMMHFENESLIYSMSDDGMVGYTAPYDPKYGDGFGWKPSYSLLASGGIFAEAEGQRTVSAFKTDPPYASDFVPIQPFGGNAEPAACILSDSIAFTPVGMNVQQQCEFSKATSSATIWSLTITPAKPDGKIEDVGVGYVFDWDIGARGADNHIRRDDDCIPTALRGQQSAGFVISREAYPVALCVATVSQTPTDMAQMACMLIGDLIDDDDGFTPADRIILLTSGTTWATDNIGDVAATIGMRRQGAITNARPFSFKVVVGAGASTDAAKAAVRLALEAVTSVEEQAHTEIPIRPNPVISQATVSVEQGACTIDVVNITGQHVMRVPTNGAHEVRLATAELPSGSYAVVVRTADGRVLSTRYMVHL